MNEFARYFQIDSATRILDVGGEPYNWSLLSTKPKITIINLYHPGRRPSGDRWIVADGCRLPFSDRSFDVVFSNSVIEHLSSNSNQKRFADEVARVGEGFWIQTPNRSFPIEPHYATPMIHFLPKETQKVLIRNFTLWGILTRPTQAQCNSMLKELKLLSRRNLTSLFPQARILVERTFGLDKSLIATRSRSHFSRQH
jgi:hypothetical protein